MSVITVNKFSGVSPMTPPRYLPDQAAQTAINCPVWLGSLQPIRNTAVTTLNTDGSFTKTGDIKSIYRYGQDQTDELKYWFHWTEEVDVVKGFINADTTERTYYTLNDDAQRPKVTNTSLALGAGTPAPTAAYPLDYYDLGVPKPTTGFITSKSGTPNTSEPSEERVYTYTYVNSYDEESAPYSATDMTAETITVYPGETVTLSSIPTAPTGDYNVTKKRIYRSATGTAETSFFFVAEVPVATTSYVDNVEADSLSEEIPSLTWEQAPVGLKGLIGLSNGVMVGFKGNDVYFAEPYRPFAWPQQYIQTVEYPIVGIAAIDTTVVVLTEGRPYFLQGSHPDSMVMVEADVNQACVSKRSIQTINGMVYYASPDGIVKLAPGGSQVVTQSMFDKYTWQNAFDPAKIVAAKFENQYIGFYQNASAGNGGFVIDTVGNTFNFHEIYAKGIYNDLRNDTLFVVVDNKLHKWDTGSVMTYKWKSKKFTTPEPKSFSCCRVEAEAYPVTLTVWRDGTQILSTSVTDGSLQRLPSGLGNTWEFQLQGTAEVYNVQFAQSPMELNAQ